MKSIVLSVLMVSALSPRLLFADQKPEKPKLRPLDTRTRSIVLFRECLNLVKRKDLDSLLLKTADDDSIYRYYPTRKSLPRDIKEELKDVDELLKNNFRRSAEIHGKFGKIQFSDVQTASDKVTLKNMALGSTHKAKLHVIQIKIPGIKDARFSKLRFVEIEDALYWVPFGW